MTPVKTCRAKVVDQKKYHNGVTTNAEVGGANVLQVIQLSREPGDRGAQVAFDAREFERK